MSNGSSVREMIDAWEAKEWRRMMREKLVETAEELEQTRQDLNTAEEYAASLEKIAKDKDAKIAEYAALVERAKNTNSENLRRLVETENKLDQVTQHRDALLLDGDPGEILRKKNEELGETIRLLRDELNEKNILLAQLEKTPQPDDVGEPKEEEAEEKRPARMEPKKKGNRGGKPRFSKQDIAGMVDMRNAGATLQEIADTYGASSGGVSYILSKHGVLKPEKPRAELTKRIDVGKVWALHDAGWTPKRIAEEFFSLHIEPEEIEEILRQPRPIREDEPEEEDEE